MQKSYKYYQASHNYTCNSENIDCKSIASLSHSIYTLYNKTTYNSSTPAGKCRGIFVNPLLLQSTKLPSQEHDSGQFN